jgi:hypothetical protein
VRELPTGYGCRSSLTRFHKLVRVEARIVGRKLGADGLNVETPLDMYRPRGPVVPDARRTGVSERGYENLIVLACHFETSLRQFAFVQRTETMRNGGRNAMRSCV